MPLYFSVRIQPMTIMCMHIALVQFCVVFAVSIANESVCVCVCVHTKERVRELDSA